MKSFLFYGVDGETGDGLKMGEAIGAATINMDLVKQYPQGVETRPHHRLGRNGLVDRHHEKERRNLRQP